MLSPAAVREFHREVEREASQTLVARLKAGDATAFDEVYESYHRRVYAFVARMVRRQDVAEDMLQETWLRLAAHAPRLRDDTELGAWLFTVARNLCRSYHRWRVLDSERLGEFSLRRDQTGTTPYDRAAANQLELHLEQALAKLSPKYREVVLLVTIERMTPTEAASILGVKPDTLRQRLARARAMIAKSLGDLVVDDTGRPSKNARRKPKPGKRKAG